MARLLDAAVIALEQTGYHATRVDDVVRLAGVSHGTFYLYFPNKEALFRAVAERCVEETAELANSLGAVAPDESGVATLETWLGDFLALYRRSGAVIRAWSEQQTTDRSLGLLGARSFGRISRTLRARLPFRPGDTDRDVELRASAMLAMIERFAAAVTTRDLGMTDADVVARLAPAVHRGFFRTNTPAAVS